MSTLGSSRRPAALHFLPRIDKLAVAHFEPGLAIVAVVLPARLDVAGGSPVHDGLDRRDPVANTFATSDVFAGTSVAAAGLRSRIKAAAQRLNPDVLPRSSPVALRVASLARLASCCSGATSIFLGRKLRQQVRPVAHDDAAYFVIDGQIADQARRKPWGIVDARIPAFSHDWGYSSAPGRVGRALPLPRGRLVGGCSATNACFALRGSPADYDRWGAMGNEGWSFKDCLPYFCAFEADADFGSDSWHGASGPLPMRRYGKDERNAFHEALISAAAGLHPNVADHNAPGAVGVGPLPVNAVGVLRTLDFANSRR